MDASQYVAGRIEQFQAQMQLLREFSLELSPLEISKTQQNATYLRTGLEALERKLSETQAWFGKPAVNICDGEFLAKFIRRERSLVADDPDILSIEMRRLAGAVYLSNEGRVCGLDISYLKNLCSLEELSELTGLVKLRLAGGRFTLQTLSSLPRLSEFVLHQSDREDLSALTAHQALRRLDLQNNKVRDIRFVAQLPNLQFLDLSFNPIQDFTPLMHLLNVDTLALSEFGKVDLEPLLYLPRLKQVTIFSRQRGARSASPVVEKLEQNGVVVLAG